MKTALIIIFALAAAVFAWLYFDLRSRIVELSDNAPKSLAKNNIVLELQNEIKPYIKVENGKVKLRIVNDKK